jgi:glycosyltransferase involved in cell wall biosynthesis
MKISVVIPAFNEEAGIGAVLDEIPVAALEKAGYEVEKVVVDNASSDRTAEIARKRGATVVYQPKRGYGNAYKAGFFHATGNIIVTGDGDLTYPFKDLPAIIAKLRDEDLDFMNTDRLSVLDRKAMHASHIFGNKVLTMIMRTLFNVPFRDSQSGMWVFRRDIWPLLDVHSGGMPFSQEIKIEAYVKGLRCGEVPITYRQRVGDVKLSVHDAWRTMFELFKKRVSVRRGRMASLTQPAIAEEAE